MKVLVAPLCWGLGHAGRSGRVVDALLGLGVEVVLASDGDALALLRREYPTLPSFALPSYGIRYPYRSTVLNVATQLPQIVRAMVREQRETAKIVAENGITCIISDSRLGVYHKSIPSFLVSHQTTIRPFSTVRRGQTGVARLAQGGAVWGNRAAEGILSRLLNGYVRRRFAEVWIPDRREEPSLSGLLSHRRIYPHTYFMGNLSRMRYEPHERVYDCAVVLSGPEPQRTHLETLVLASLEEGNFGNLRIIVSRGLPTLTDPPRRLTATGGGVADIVPFLPRHDLSRVLCSSGVVICRSGYSTLMDLAACHTRAALIATPAQTEQEYLAEHLHAQHIYLNLGNQHDYTRLDFNAIIASAAPYAGIWLPNDDAALSAFLSERLTT